MRQQKSQTVCMYVWLLFSYDCKIFTQVTDDVFYGMGLAETMKVHAIPIFRLTRGVASEQIWPNRPEAPFGASMRRAVM